MSNFTLDDIRTATEAKYGSTNIDLGDGDTVRLLNPLRLPKARRAELTSLQESFSPAEGDEDEAAPDEDAQVETLRAILRVAAESEGPVERLITACGDDIALLMTVFETYIAGAQVGEASASRD